MVALVIVALVTCKLFAFAELVLIVLTPRVLMVAFEIVVEARVDEPEANIFVAKILEIEALVET